MRQSSSVHNELTIASFSLSTLRMSNTDEIVSFLYSSGEKAALNALQTVHNVDKVTLSSDRCHAIRLRCSVSIGSVLPERCADESSRRRRRRVICLYFAFNLKFMLILTRSSTRTTC